MALFAGAGAAGWMLYRTFATPQLIYRLVFFIDPDREFSANVLWTARTIGRLWLFAIAAGLALAGFGELLAD